MEHIKRVNEFFDKLKKPNIKINEDAIHYGTLIENIWSIVNDIHLMRDKGVLDNTLKVRKGLTIEHINNKCDREYKSIEDIENLPKLLIDYFKEFIKKYESQ